MSRKCVCSITKEQGTTDTFYCVTTNGKNKYYKSKEIYEEFKREEIQKEKTIAYVLGILGYEYSPYLVKKLNELHQHFTYETIHLAFEQQEDKIKYALDNRLSQSKEPQKITYIFKIIENVINDVKPAKQTQSEVEIDIDDLNRIKYTPIKHININQFLESEDL